MRKEQDRNQIEDMKHLSGCGGWRFYQVAGDVHEKLAYRTDGQVHYYLVLGNDHICSVRWPGIVTTELVKEAHPWEESHIHRTLVNRYGEDQADYLMETRRKHCTPILDAAKHELGRTLGLSEQATSALTFQELTSPFC